MNYLLISVLLLLSPGIIAITALFTYIVLFAIFLPWAILIDYLFGTNLQNRLKKAILLP